MNSQQHFRQGDVMVRAVASLPAGLTEVPRDAGRVVLAYGEVTGHAHAIRQSSAKLFMAEDPGRRFLVIDGEAAELRHEEHGTIALAPGHYEVVIQREYSPEEIRQVQD